MRQTDRRESQRGKQANVEPTKGRKAKRNRSGVAMIWTAIVGTLLLLIIGICVDTAKVALVAHQLQNAADAAALAGGRIVKFDQAAARALAVSYGQRNFADLDPVLLEANVSNVSDGDIVVGRYNRRLRTFTPSLDRVNAIKVVARCTDSSLNDPVSLNFGPIAGIQTANVSRYAIAMSSGGTFAGLIALRPDRTGLYINGSVTLDVNDGDIQVNSEDGDAVVVKGQPDVWADELNITGEYDNSGGFEFDPDVPVNIDMPPVPDPLCPDPAGGICLPEPTWDPINDLVYGPDTLQITEGTHVLEPGYYPGGFNFTGGNITLKPGIYILGGGPEGKGGLVIGGNTNFCAMGVMFFITENGKVDLAGTGNIRVTGIGAQGEECEFCDPSFTYGPNTDYTYHGVSIFQARDNYNDARIVGTNLMDLEETLYFPNNHLDLTGTGDGFGTALIAGSLEISGTGKIGINYDGRYDSPGTSSYLVE